MFTIESHLLQATIHPKGAELTKLYHKGLELDYLWNGDPAFWGKHSPVLFPIVGALKKDTYYYNGEAYQLPRHGFARDQQFAIETQAFDSITFLLRHSETTRQVFPFAVDFRIVYTIYEDSLGVSYQVTNTGTAPMYFSVGGHPAFKLPLVEGTSYDDYSLTFDQVETAGRWPIADGGLIAAESLPMLNNTQQLPLSKALFHKDALVFKNLQSTRVSLRSAKTTHGLDMDIPGFPYLGIWAAKDADFVCIEPWCGIADNVNASQQLTEKEGINKLEGGGTFIRTWTVRVW